MSEVKRVVADLDGQKLVGYRTPKGRKTHWGDEGKTKAQELSKRGQKAAKTRALRKLISGG